MEVYRGNYSHYVQQREARHARQLETYRRQQERIEKEEAYIQRNIAGQNTRQAQGRRKRLERFLRDEAITRPRTDRTIRIRLESEYRSGEKVLMTEGLVVGYHDDRVPLFAAPDITLYRREIAALIGPNGVGKTTFIKTILSELAPLGGEVRVGASVKVGYFAQGHEGLDPTQTVLDAILAIEDMPLSQRRAATWRRFSSRATTCSSPSARSAAASAGAWRWRGWRSAARTCSCSTSRPTTSIFRRRRFCRPSSPTSTGRFCS
ncbi:MAG: ATP-binding cassette domain-containing protein [Anaerolineae bacterium]|nr:ATP-binding cassette domain-containing protein [Anaerolineae bacterium]